MSHFGNIGHHLIVAIIDHIPNGWVMFNGTFNDPCRRLMLLCPRCPSWQEAEVGRFLPDAPVLPAGLSTRYKWSTFHLFWNCYSKVVSNWSKTMKIAEQNREKSKKQNKHANTSWLNKKAKTSGNRVKIGFREALRNPNLVENGFSVSSLK